MKPETPTDDAGYVFMSADALTKNEITRSNLLNLPPELRMEIYELVFVAIEDERSRAVQRDLGIRSLWPKLFAIGLVQTNRLIRSEVTPLFVCHLRALSTGLKYRFGFFLKECESHIEVASAGLRLERDRIYTLQAAQCINGIENASSALQHLNQYETDGTLIPRLRVELAKTTERVARFRRGLLVLRRLEDQRRQRFRGLLHTLLGEV